MAHRYAEIAFTPAVLRSQEEHGSRDAYAKILQGPDHHHRLGTRERAFVEARNSFYIATVSETGWPYIQHRGGPAGFLRVLDDHTLGFADFSGNRQYVTLGNLAGNDKVSLFLMDYQARQRLKIFGRARAVNADDPLVQRKLVIPGYPAKVERALIICVAGFDWNCPQHIGV